MKGHHMQDVAVLALDEVDGSNAHFSVQFIGKKASQQYYCWLSLNKVLDAGDTNPDAFTPIQWNGLGGVAVIAIEPGCEYKAFISVHPDVWTERSNEVDFTT